jgi:hypothetical protein
MPSIIDDEGNLRYTLFDASGEGEFAYAILLLEPESGRVIAFNALSGHIARDVP